MGIGVTALTDIKLKEERDMAKRKSRAQPKEPVLEKPKLIVPPKPEPKAKSVKYRTVYIEATIREMVHSKNLLVVSKPIYAGKGATLLPYIELTEEIKKRLG